MILLSEKNFWIFHREDAFCSFLISRMIQVQLVSFYTLISFILSLLVVHTSSNWCTWTIFVLVIYAIGFQYLWIFNISFLFLQLGIALAGYVLMHCFWRNDLNVSELLSMILKLNVYRDLPKGQRRYSTK